MLLTDHSEFEVLGGLALQWQLLFPPTVGLTILAEMSPEIRVGRIYILCVIFSPGWQNSWELSVCSREDEEEVVRKSGGGI